MIVKRGNNYGVSVYDRSLGRKRWIGTFPTKADARIAEREAAAKPALGTRTKCSEFAVIWQRDHARPSPATQRTYEYGLKSFLREFGDRKMVDLDKPTARAWAMRSPISNVRIVKTMFNDAISDGVHPGPNPFANLRLPQGRGRKDLVALSEGDIWKLVRCVDEVLDDYIVASEIASMIVFAAFVGLRPGELFALKPDDVDTERRTVHVRRNVDSLGNIKKPKNGLTREVILPPQAAMYYETNCMRGREWLFMTPREKRFTRGSLYYYWRPIRLAAGRPGMDFYELRHFCATHLLELGCSPSDVAVQLGHTDNGALVMSTYGHPSEENARERLTNAYRDNEHWQPYKKRGSQSGSNAYSKPDQLRDQG